VLSSKTGTLARASATAAAVDTSLAVPRAALWALIAAKLVSSWGVQWDIQWHTVIGRDTFWIPPHLMTYSGVTLMVLLSFGVLAWTTLRPTGRSRDVVSVLGIAGTRGFHLAAWGIALTVLAAPIDDLWHRLFGIDVTLWSPPHLLGLFGAAVNTLGCFLIAREVYPARSRAGFAALVATGALLLVGLQFVMQPAFRLAYLYGGVAFHSYALLAPLLLPVAYLATARLSRVGWSPLLVILLAIAISLCGRQIARVGFDVLQPVSIIQEEIAKDPTSPIAVANAIARKNGTAPGATAGLVQLIGLIPVAALVAAGPQRRPVASTVAYALVLFAVMGARLALLPAFQEVLPSAGETVAALVLTALTALAGGWYAARLAALLDPGPSEH
jgi:hypothetical protein